MMHLRFSIRRIKFLFVLFFCLAPTMGETRARSLKKVKSVDWVAMAKNLTGESESVRRKALKRLRAMKSIDETLAREIKRPVFQEGKLNTKRFLALDVIAALKRQSLMPVLISESFSDSTGYTYHTMNTLMTTENADSLVRLYHRRLVSYPASSAAKLALLDTLGRMGFELSLSELRQLNRNSSDEIKSGLLSYLRELMILKNRILYQEFLPEIMVASSFEVKMQALFLFEELLDKKKMKFKDADLQCAKDTNKVIQNFCKKITGSFS